MSGITAAAPVPAPGTRFMVQWEEHPMHLATRLGYLLEHQSLVDVTLMCNTHTLKVHRSVLAACSPYFESVLQRQLGNHPLIVLKDMKFCVLKSLIEFMYCGETSVTEENLNPLMEAAKFFEVKGLCTMSKEVLGGERPSPNKPVTANPVNGTSNSIADIIPTSSYRGRGRRPGVGRGRRNLSTMLVPPPTGQGAPQAETAQIMLSLSSNTAGTGGTLQTTSRNVRISPNSRVGRPLQPVSALLRNGSLDTTDLRALREQLNLEPRRRGRRRQNFGLGRGRIKDLGDSKFGIQNIKKEMDDIQQKDGILVKPLDSKVNLFGNNGNNDAKSPLLASLLSKAEALAKAKVKTENDGEEGQTSEQETVLYQFDGESSGATKYLDALKEAGLPTDVPVLIDNGDGNYVTLTEDVLMNVLGNNEEFQFQVTEATLEQGDVSEGIVLQDGTIMMTGKNGKSDLTGPLLTVSNKGKPVTIKGIKEVKGKRGPKPKQIIVKDMQGGKSEDIISPQKGAKKESGQKSAQEMINDAVLESLKNGAASEAETDPDAVVLYEVTDNDQVCKYVVSSKEISALKALNEQIEKQKRQNSPGEKKSPLSTLMNGKANIAEIKLTVPKNSRKSIVSEVLARAHSLEHQVSTGLLDQPSQENHGDKDKVDSPQLLDINMETDVLNDSSQLMNMNPARDNLENPSTMDLSEEAQVLGVDNSMVVLNDESGIMELKEHDEDINMSDSEHLIVMNNNNQILQQEGIDLAEEPSEDSQLMQINESSQDGGETEGAAGVVNEETDESVPQSGRDMPLLETDPQLVELQFINGNGQKIEDYRVEGTVLSHKEISEITGLDSHQGKDSDVIGLLDMVCEEAAAQEDISNQVLNDVNTLKQNVSSVEAMGSVTSVENSIVQSEYNLAKDENGFTRTEHLVLEEVQNIDSRHLQSTEMSLDEGECPDLSVEQALQAMMGDENSTEVETQEFGEEHKHEDESQEETSLHQLTNVPPESGTTNLVNPNSFEFVYDANENPPNESIEISLQPETHILSELSTNETVEAEVTEGGGTEEAIIVSPTKDVPFAVGLLPLKDALVQIQSIPEYQPRKTRSGSTCKMETPGSKRRSSVENFAEGSVKRRKSVEDENSSSLLTEEENALSLT
ncbi:uncharacterized protein LOC124359415 [Homalodisca vitripennis]|nr:uncharacterized protein LOC124359415 [Homalodisca vitripennis]XP_046668101.1 uncharacterized protein LOC124359415 [Homalodisca vitripennis]